ncbi:hypothetical protein AC578_6251 [Pseudocercospora eumusae]|uniref:Beta-lactamase-related domain-containing protein n=1 Tax=Pseudocercospora eumusae TaxID=321146 RepID=A0A139GZR8_9PEZI|nr:hypothetical protein AC578_6251 [Pseudocercospora eumusae]
MNSAEEALAQGVKDGKIPFAIIAATNADGSFEYHHAAGFQHCGTNEDPIQEDALIMLASQSKLITAIACMKMVELGHITLDDDVTPHMPELAKKQIFTGFTEDNKPIFVDRKNPITLRQLLTHSSGVTYGMNPNIVKLELSSGRPSPVERKSATVAERFDFPMTFEPGTSWEYSPGLDWAGLLLHRLTGLTLEEFEKKYFWDPLGITGLTFWPSEEAKKTKQADLVIRGDDGKFSPNGTTPTLNTFSKECFGGHGMYAVIPDYLKVLRSLLANDGKLLNPSSVDELFKPQLGTDSEKHLNSFVQAWHTMIPGDFNPKIHVQYALGGIVFMEDDVGRRKKGTLSWGGLYNPFWIVDRTSGLAYTFGTQVLPTGDPGCKEMEALMESAVYKMAGVA